MDIMVKGMEMPKSCHACCFFGQADIWTSEFDGYTKSFCKRTGSQTFDYVEKFLPDCPLVPVPPHGRLGDFDEFLNRAFGTGLFNEDDMRLLQELVGESSIVIPAEEGE